VSARWLAWSLASPSQLLVVATVAGAALVMAGRGGRSARLLLGAGVAGLLLFGVLPTASYLGHVLETRFPLPQLPRHVDGILLLAGAERPSASVVHGEPQVGASGGRYLTALRLARLHPEARVVFVGGQRRKPGRGPDETQAAVGRQILYGAGLDPRRVTWEGRSGDTCDGAQHARALAQPRATETWVVVTSAIHMPRTMACFRAAGWPEVVPHGADYQTAVGRWSSGSFQVARNLELLDLAAHEWLGLAYYRLSGRTREFMPPR